jgi:hypothetical protein
MYKLSLLLLLLVAQDVQVGTPPDGPYAHKEGYVCWRQPDQVWEGKHFVKCSCKMSACNMGEVMETSDCLTYCGDKQCVCHADEACPMPEDPQR